MVKEQLTLRFGWGDGFSFASYFSAANESAVHLLQQLDYSGTGNDTDHFVYLWGGPGTGKSHLLQAACQSAADAEQLVAYLPLQDLANVDPGIFVGLEQMALVCIDDVQVIAGNDDWEEGLFHLYNRMRGANKVLLVAGNVAPVALSRV